MKKVSRIQNPGKLNPKEIIVEIESGNEVVVQFSEAVYDPVTLEALNEICKVCNEDLCVRFYNHIRQGFDCSTLKYLPDVKSLYLDCLLRVSNFDELKHLRHLKRINIGIFELDDSEFLSWENLKAVSDLCLVDTRKNNFNLKYLNEYSQIETLFLNGHTRNIEAVGYLSKLSKLSLSVPSKASIGFLNNIPDLKKLTLVLGGRSNLDEVHNASLEELEIIRVRGFASLDNVSEFPKLRRLLIEDQIQIENVGFTSDMPVLADLRFLNCKSLKSVTGLQHLSGLRHFRVYKTAIEFDEFMKNDFPKSLKILAFYTTKVKTDKEIRDRLRKLGYYDGISG